MLRSATWRTDRLAAAADDPLIAATDLADHLTQRGLPFRQAHEVVGQLVKRAEASGRRLSEFGLDELREFSPLFDETAVRLGAAELVAARDVPGGTAPARFHGELAAAKERMAASREWIAIRRAALPTLERVLTTPDTA
jgi:argininosuccinate lyase